MKINDKEIIIQDRKLNTIKIDKILEKEDTITLRYIKNNKRYYNIYNHTICAFCKKEIYISTKTMKTNKQWFCTSRCRSFFHKKIKDIKNFELMTHINDLNFCYYIGLLASDGTICYPAEDNKYRAYQARIQLQEQDKNILEKLQQLFGGKLNCYKGGNLKKDTWQHELNNIDFVLYLRNIVGLTTKKSHTLNIATWFNELSNNNKYAFIKGFFDGDGSIYTQQQNNLLPCYKIKFSSCSIHFINMLYDFMKNEKINCYRDVDKINDCHSIRIHGKTTLPFIKKLLSIDTISLDRKNKKMQELVKFYSSTQEPSG